MHNFLRKTALMVILPLALSSHAIAGHNSRAKIDIEITNLSNAIYFTPLLVSAHRSSFDLFEAGTGASDELQEMAEGGNIDGLAALADQANASTVLNPAEGLLAPSGTASISKLSIKGKNRLSIVAMMLPTNDGFIGLDSWRIPRKRGTYTIYLNGYDAGTEANDELITGGGAPGVPGIPFDPGSNAGAGGSGVIEHDPNTTVHIHPGNIGDNDLSSGSSDLDSRVHRWLNPVAKVVVRVY